MTLLLSTTHRSVLIQDTLCKIPLSNKPMMSLLLSLGSLVLSLGSYKGSGPVGCSPTILVVHSPRFLSFLPFFFFLPFFPPSLFFSFLFSFLLFRATPTHMEVPTLEVELEL